MKRLRQLAHYLRAGVPAEPLPPPSAETRSKVKAAADKWLEKLNRKG